MNNGGLKANAATWRRIWVKRLNENSVRFGFEFEHVIDRAAEGSVGQNWKQSQASFVLFF